MNWLASLTARVDDLRSRSIARHLNDELGDGGDLSRIHLRIFDRLLEDTSHGHQCPLQTTRIAPGRRPAASLAARFLHADPAHGIGTIT